MALNSVLYFNIDYLPGLLFFVLVSSEVTRTKPMCTIPPVEIRLKESSTVPKKRGNFQKSSPCFSLSLSHSQPAPMRGSECSSGGRGPQKSK